MTTLYIDRKGTQLCWRDGAIVLRLPDEEVRTVPAALLDRVVIRTDIQLSSSALASITERGIGVIAFGGRAGQRVAHVIGGGSRDCRARIAQCQRVADSGWVEKWCRMVVRQRLRGQALLLARVMDARPDLRKPLFDGGETLQRVLRRLPAAVGREEIRGLEGAGAAAFFRAYRHLFPDAAGFLARRRRPPPDPVNACLSLGYTLLQGRAVQACWAAGLDPMVGFLHSPAYGRASLACDLIEAQRARIESWVWSAWRDRTIRLEHFGSDGAGACVLGKAGREHYYTDIHPILKRCERGLTQTARRLARSLAASARGFDEGEDWNAEDFES